MDEMNKMNEKPFWKSKKFYYALCGVGAAFGAPWLSLNQDQIWALIGPIIALILGQGLADLGKSRRRENFFK
jgi:hypothetical protein